MSQSVEQALAITRPITDGRDYLIIGLPAASITAAAGIVAEIGEPFGAVIIDKNEVTLIIPAEALEDFAQRIPGHRIIAQSYRLITLDVVLEPTMVGYVARVTSALAEADIPILPVAAFSRDHLLIPATYFERAMSVLSQLTGKGGD